MCAQSANRHCPTYGNNSRKHSSRFFDGNPHNPTSLNPGESTTYPSTPPSNEGSGCIDAPTVVCRPLFTDSLISPTRKFSPGNRVLSSDDFPTPDGPLSTDTFPRSVSRTSSNPIRSFT